MKIVFAIIIAFIIIDVLIIAYVMYRRMRRKLSSKVIGEIRSNWKDIIRQSDYRHAIMEADKLLDHTLTHLGLKGNLGSKLKGANHLFSDINKVWTAHKERNNIAHRINYKINEKTYRKTMLAYKQAFKDLKIF